jgi:hypothetical protein
VVAGVVLVGVVVGGVVAVVAAQRDSGGGRAASGGATGAGTTAVSAPPSTVGAPAAGVVFSQAGARLAEAGSFRYSGAVSAFDVSAVRPSLWLAVNLAVTGQVVTTDGRLHEVAVANTGQATETVAAGEQVWGRSAPGPDGLGDASYELIPGLAGARGAAFLPAWLAAATDPTDAGLDPQGRPTYRATVPASVIGPVERGRAAADAVITLSVDRDGTPAHVDIVAPAGDDPRLHLAIDLAGLGEPVTIDPPG